MRTKTLLLSAVLGLATVATSQAETFSVNAVGYINLDVRPGFSIIANQLNKSGGNSVTNIFSFPPGVGVTLYKFNGVGYEINNYDPDFQEWDDNTQTLSPGEAAFINNPQATNIVVTLVGEVPQGSLTNEIPQGFSLRSHHVPQSALLSTDLDYPATAGDQIFRFRVGAAAGYSIYTYDADFAEWDEQPAPNVGEGFFVNKPTAGTKEWTRTFSVNTPTP